MNPQRSRSRQRTLNPKREKPHESSGQLNNKYEMGNYQSGPSNERRSHEKSASNTAEFPKPQLYPPPQINQFRKSASPNRMGQQQGMMPGYPNPQLNLYPNQNNRSPVMPMKEVGLSKIDKIQELANWLRSAKKPFQSSQASNLQSALDKITPKYRFQQIYQVFVYFFIHSFQLDQNLYKVFYSLISTNAMTESMNPDYLSRFYETLIRTTLKTSFEEFKGRISGLESARPEDYFKVSHQLRQKIVNRSLYQVGETATGCSIRNTLTLIRKVMEREKNSDKSSDLIHPIRQVLKVLKSITKSILHKIFTQKPSQAKKDLSTQTQDCQNTFHMILISQLSLIIHFKYKNHISAEFQETLNEMTILKMGMTEAEQQIESHFQKQETNPVSLKQTEEDVIKNLKTNLENLDKQHKQNYLYLLFVLNLSSYYSAQSEQYDLSLFWFYAKPFLEEYSRSSDFLSQKISQNPENSNKCRFFSTIIKNFGIENQWTNDNNQPLARFAHESRSNILLKSIQYILSHLSNATLAQNADTQSSDKFLTAFNALSSVKTNFNRINEFSQNKSDIEAFIESECSNRAEKYKINHINKQFEYLVDSQLKWLKKNINEVQDNVKGMMVKVAGYKIKFQQKKKVEINHKKVLDQEREDKAQQKILKRYQLPRLRQWFQSLSSTIDQESYIKLLAIIYLLHKEKKWQQARKQLSKLNKIIEQIKDKQSQNSDLIMAEQDEKTSVSGLKNTLKESLDALVNEISLLKKTQILIIQLIQEQSKRCISSGKDTKIIAKLIKRMSTYENTQANKINESAPSIMSIIVHDLISQQKSYEVKLREVISKLQVHKIITENKEDRIAEERQELSTGLDQKDILAQHQVNEFISQVKQCIKLRYESIVRNSSLSLIESKLRQKKSQLLQQQVLTKKLPSVLDSIKKLYLQYSFQKSLQNLIPIQALIQKLVLNIFKLNQELNHSYPQDLAHNQNSKKASQSEKLPQKNIISALNLQAYDPKSHTYRQSSNPSKLFAQQIQLFLSEILSTIYLKFMSTFSMIKQQANFGTKKQQTSKSLVTLEQIFVHKLKKCISLFYDKINDRVVCQFVINRKLFILRCIVITFYKIKSLCDILITTFGVFDKQTLNEVNPQRKEMFQFVQKVFFNIQDQKLLQPYVTFLMSKDKFYLRTQLFEYAKENQHNKNIGDLINVLQVQ